MFNRVIISFSNHHCPPDIRQFIMDNMQEDRVVFVDSSNQYHEHWYQKGMMSAIACSTSSHILFTEQDFIIKNEGLLETVFQQDGVVGFKEASLSRLHPAFCYIPRDVFEKTTKDFTNNSPHWDNFGKITVDLDNQNVPYQTLEELGFSSPGDWEHLAGLTHNYTLLIRNEPITYQKERFIEFNRQSLALDIPQDPVFGVFIKKASQL
jgi:hypothetical protein